jgi:hypothetical protein
LSGLDDVELKIHGAGRIPPPRHEIYGDGSGCEIRIFPNRDARVGGSRCVEVDISFLCVKASRVPFDLERLQGIDGLLVRWSLVKSTTLTG